MPPPPDSRGPNLHHRTLVAPAEESDENENSRAATTNKKYLHKSRGIVALLGAAIVLVLARDSIQELFTISVKVNAHSNVGVDQQRDFADHVYGTQTLRTLEQGSFAAGRLDKVSEADSRGGDRVNSIGSGVAHGGQSGGTGGGQVVGDEHNKQGDTQQRADVETSNKEEATPQETMQETNGNEKVIATPQENSSKEEKATPHETSGKEGGIAAPQDITPAANRCIGLGDPNSKAQEGCGETEEGACRMLGHTEVVDGITVKAKDARLPHVIKRSAGEQAH